MNENPDLEYRLKIATERQRRAFAALAPQHKGGEQEEAEAATQEVLSLERQLAAAKGDEYAEPFGFPLKWDTGAPMPHLMVSDHRALLSFLLSEPDPAWDGSYVKVVGVEEPEPLALVEFEHCTSAKLGSPNDEVFGGHPLSGKGSEPYSAQRVINSRWIKEIQAINSVHHRYRPEHWRDLYHFIFWFHDTTFECIARSYKVETHRISMRALLNLMAERMIA